MAAIKTSNEHEALLVRLEQLATKIDALMVAKGEVVDAMDYHVWTRPQLDVEAFDEDAGFVYYMLMRLADEPRKSYGVNNQPSLGLVFDGFGNHVEMRFSASTADKLRIVEVNPACFERVEQALTRAAYALENDSSMQEGLSNAQVLRDQLLQLPPSEVAAWQRMVGVWGSKEMVVAINVANSLADPTGNLDHWKALVASSWAQPEGPTLSGADAMDMFSEQPNR